MSHSDDPFYRKPWMTDDHWRCACLLSRVFGGFHHMKEVKQRADGVSAIVHQHDLATFDFSHLTALVILAHQRCIRVAICTAGMRLEVRAYPRVRVGTMYERHPTLEEAVSMHGDPPNDKDDRAAVGGSGPSPLLGRFHKTMSHDAFICLYEVPPNIGRFRKEPIR